MIQSQNDTSQNETSQYDTGMVLVYSNNRASLNTSHGIRIVYSNTCARFNNSQISSAQYDKMQATCQPHYDTYSGLRHTKCMITLRILILILNV